MKTKIAVIGAGVIGLTCGIRLSEAGFAVTLFARDVLDGIASRAAPALWTPFKALPFNDLARWSVFSLEIYKNLSLESGVSPIEFYDFYHGDEMPLWTTIRNDFKVLPKCELPFDYKQGFVTTNYLADTTVYIDYLITRFEKLGGSIIQQNLQQLDDVESEFLMMINCSGLGAKDLVPDASCFPIRGQYILTDKPLGLQKVTFATLDNDTYILIVPRLYDCYLGGTIKVNDWDQIIHPEITENILTNACRFEPLLKNVSIHKEIVAFRPGRASIRLEAEQLSDFRHVIHNYGHGGAGFTVSWGCAEDVLLLVNKYFA